MEVLNKIKGWAAALAEVGVSLAALAIILEVLGLGNMPFMPKPKYSKSWCSNETGQKG